MSDLPADTLTTTIANVLDDHLFNGCTKTPCNPGRSVDDIPRPFVVHAAQEIAAAVVSVLATHNEQVAADALRDAADDFDSDTSPLHMMSAADCLRHRADRLAAVSPTPPTHKEQA